MVLSVNKAVRYSNVNSIASGSSSASSVISNLAQGWSKGYAVRVISSELICFIFTFCKINKASKTGFLVLSRGSGNFSANRSNGYS
ncbi:hypothetical protein D3C72_1591740 [compost metagenome]